MAFGLGAPELTLIMLIVLIVFGVGRLGDVGGAIGRSIREFRHALKDDEHESLPNKQANSSANTQQTH